MSRKKILVAAVVAIGSLLILVGSQLNTAINESDEAYRTAVLEWANGSTQRAALLALYQAKCRRPAKTEIDLSKASLDGPMSRSECASEVARQHAASVGLSVEEAAGLGDAIASASDGIEIPIPLRWL